MARAPHQPIGEMVDVDADTLPIDPARCSKPSSGDVSTAARRRSPAGRSHFLLDTTLLTNASGEIEPREPAPLRDRILRT
ncbi:MAG: hypothetical protein R2710_31340 [Acidimicrobiales bacterium]